MRNHVKIFSLLMVCGLYYTAGYGQKISLKESKTPVERVLASITRQSGYVFFYNKATIAGKTISVQVSNADIKTALDACFKDLSLEYTITQKTVVISEKEEKNGKQPQPVDTIPVQGRVFSNRGAPLDGASVLIRKYKLETATDNTGSFRLSVPKKDFVVEVSYVGYKPKELKYNDDLSTIVLDTAASQVLDVVNVVGYGTESRRFSVGATYKVEAATIEKQPVVNVLSALQGQVPGLFVTTASGVPGSQVKVQIRGQNTLRTAIINDNPFDEPLFIIDGVQISSQNKNIAQNGYLFNNNTQPGGYSALTSLNPNDIESISVLKDADATSIYGSQGANGVVIITTKKGKPGKTVLNLSAYTGYTFATRSFKLLNTQQYLALRNEAFANDKITPDISDPYSNAYAPDLLLFDSNQYTDFFHLIRNNTTRQTDAHATLSGGTEATSFIIGAGYTGSGYDFPGNFADKRYTVHTGLRHLSPNKKLGVNFSADYSYDRNNSAGNFAANTALFYPSNLPTLLDANGNLIWSYQGVSLRNYQFFSYLKQPSVNNLYNLNSSVNITYKLAAGLNLILAAGYNQVRNTEAQAKPKSSQDPSGFPVASASFGSGVYQLINAEPQLDYDRKIGNGSLSFLLGGTYRKNVGDNTYLTGYNYSSDYLLGSINAAAVVNAYSKSSLYKYAAGFTRLRYIYNQKYIISLTARRDGSSNFGPDRQFGNFGSAGLGWIFSEEKNFRKHLPFISYGKISANYGTNGSDGVQPYLYQPFWQSVIGAPAFQGNTPLSPANLYQPDYSWAVKKSLNVGLDIGLFHDRLLLNGNFYLNREANQLINYPLPSQAGFSSVVENLNATVQNKGLELMMNSSNIETEHFKWSSTFSISFNRNKLLAYPDLATSSFANQYEIGKSVSIVHLFQSKGVNPQTGVFEYYDAKGNTTIQPAYGVAARGGDFTETIDLAPKFFGGFSNEFSYKHFGLSLFLQFSKQTAPNYLYELYNSYVPGSLHNLPAQVLGNYWQKPGDHAPLQRVTADDNSDAYIAASSFAFSTGAYSDDTYIRVKNISLSYNLSDKTLRRLKMTGLKLYINAQNLFTITNYKVGDPEQPGNITGFPVQRTVVAGLSFNF